MSNFTVRLSFILHVGSLKKKEENYAKITTFMPAGPLLLLPGTPAMRHINWIYSTELISLDSFTGDTSCVYFIEISLLDVLQYC